jgi:hypothetical protein
MHTREMKADFGLAHAKSREPDAVPPPGDDAVPYLPDWSQTGGGGDAATPFIGLYDGPVVQREASSAAAPRPLAADELVPSGGRALGPVVQRKMEAALGGDLGDVRIHTDDGRACAMNAEAYTVGSDIVFKNGNDDFASDAGSRRLAHELTHVIQQRSGPVAGDDLGNGVAVSDPSDDFERQAEDTADRMMGGGAPAPVSSSSNGGSGGGGASVQRVVQREESDDSSGVWDYLKKGAKKLLKPMGAVAGPVVDGADGLRKILSQPAGTVDRTLAAEDAVKGIAGDTIGGAIVDAKRKAFPFQGEVDASGTGMTGDVTGGNPSTDAPRDSQGNIDNGSQVVTDSGEIIDKQTGKSVNAGDNVLTDDVKKQLDEASAAGQSQ